VFDAIIHRRAGAVKCPPGRYNPAMATARTPRPTGRRKPPPPDRRAVEVPVIELIAWLVGLALVGFRCLIQETGEYHWRLSLGLADLSNTADRPVLVMPGPMVTVWLTVAMGGVFALWAVSWLRRDCPRPRRTHLGWPLLALALAVGVSTLTAANRRAALTAGADLLATVLLGWTLVQLLRRRWQVRVTVAVLLAAGCGQAVKAFHQVAVELPETRRIYREHRDVFLQGRAVAVDPSQQAEFEKRLAAGAATGTFSHANAFGSLLLLVGAAGAGLVAGKLTAIRHPFGWVFAAVSAVGVLAILGALLATGSLGAMVGLAVAAGAFALLRLAGGWMARRLRVVGVALLILLAAAAGGTALYGLARGRLPTANLAIRWQYWTAAARMIGRHALTGVGPGNFTDHYTRYLAPGAGEQVTDAHNLLLQSTAELGALGGLATAALFVLPAVGVARAARRRLAHPPGAPATEDRRPSRLNHAVWPAAAALLLMHGILGAAGYWPYPHLPWGLWLVLVPLLAVPFLVMAASGVLSGDRLAPLDEAPAPLLRVGLWAALAGFLVHAQISLAPSVPAVRTLAVVLIACAIALDRIDERRAATAGEAKPKSLPPWMGWGAVVAACAAMVACGVWLVRPVVEANTAMTEAVTAFRRPLLRRAPAAGGPSALPPPAALRQVRAELRHAAAADPLDATPHVLKAELFVLEGRWRDADVAFAEAIARRPHSASLASARAEALWQAVRDDARMSADQRLMQRKRAIELARSALALHPNGRDLHLRLAELLDADGQHDEATRHFRRALQLDDALAPLHPIRQLPPDARRALEQRLGGQ
jgi:O-antigen ligase